MDIINLIDDLNDEELNDDQLIQMIDEIENTVKLDKNKCINCGSLNLDVNYTCMDCGVVNRCGLDQTPEWSLYEEGAGGLVRCNAPTDIFFPSASHGSIISGSKFGGLRKIQTWGQMPQKERSLLNDMLEIEAKAEKINISKSVIDNAKIYFKKIKENVYKNDDSVKLLILKTNRKKAIIGACLFYGAQKQNMPINIKEVSKILGISLKQLNKGMNIFNNIIGSDLFNSNVNSTKPSEMIYSFGSKLELTKDHLDMAYKIACNIEKLDLVSHHQAPSFAASCIWLMNDIYKDLKDLTISKIGVVFHVTEATIIRTYSKIKDYKAILMNDKFTDKLLTKMDIIQQMILDKMENECKKTEKELTEDEIVVLDSFTSIYIIKDNDKFAFVSFDYIYKTYRKWVIKGNFKRVTKKLFKKYMENKYGKYKSGGWFNMNIKR
mgnify:CR=1 FL=1|jgi:transcription initiation factor TFIIIB Brf1 subunit/transcription initiation factor TFIIB